ncbi:MinD/ParA family ATP-binding protein [Nocardioides sp. GXZ039]|uniref:MinD/ParA family ATP-binding protein n=1 Tax=Nocardioides sp. GXZ039 TaxID=3136018 RepID=UPI0030F4AAF2
MSDHLSDHLADPVSDQVPPAERGQPAGPAGSAGPWPGGAGPTGPPPAGPPPGYAAQPGYAPAPPSSAPTAPSAPPAPMAPPHQEPAPAPVPAPVQEAPAETAHQPDVAPVAAAGEPRRFMTATDFLDRRDSEQGLGPASWGWRGRVRRWTGGLIKPAMGAKERAYEDDRAMIQRDFDGPRTIAFVNPKGGAAKTTGVLAAGYTFGTVRGGGVVAWDNNETRGTLGIRGTRSTHRNTTRELLEDLERFKDVYQSRIGDLGAFVRSQGDAHFDVLASDERPDVTGMIKASDFNEVHQLLERFYRVIIVDTGNNMRAENWLAAADAADLLVVTSTVREDTGYSGLWMLDALQDAGITDLKHKAVTVLSDPSDKVDTKLVSDLTGVYEQRTRAVYRVPYDPVLVSGSVVPYAQLSAATRRAWLRACAGMSEAL